MGYTASDHRDARPVLVFDGDCGFCVYWAFYWQKLTGERVRYRPFQEAAADYPGIAVDAFHAAIQYVAPDGSVSSGAKAAFLTLNQAGRGFWLFLYRRLPGFAGITEAAYRFIAGHRPLFFRLSRLAWGPVREPPSYELTAGLFLRLLGLVYLAAFTSLAIQVTGLIGAHGILPAGVYLDELRRSLGSEAWLTHPPSSG